MKAFKKSISVFLAMTLTCLTSGNIWASKTPKTDTSKKFIYMINSDDSATLLRINTFEEIDLPSSFDGHNLTEVASAASLINTKKTSHRLHNAGIGVVIAIGFIPILMWSFANMIQNRYPEYSILDTKETTIDLNFAKITSANLPYCKKVGEGGFLLCKNLQTVNLPECTDLSNASFECCENLTTVNLEKFKGDIPENCFRNCLKLEEVNIPNCRNIKKESFPGCKSLKKISFPHCLSVGVGAFCNVTVRNWHTQMLKERYKNLDSANEANPWDRVYYYDITYINQGQIFYGSERNWNKKNLQNCPLLEEVNLPSCKEVSSSAFMKCEKLKTLNLDKCEKIDAEALWECTSLESLNLPKLTSLGNHALRNCKNLKEINFPQVELIGESCFRGCAAIENLKLPNLTQLGVNAFENCENLKEIYIPICTGIPDFTFKNCKNLKSVHLPEIKEVGEYAFENCENLEEISLPKCTKLSKEAFKNCGKLKKVTISSSCEIQQLALPYDKLLSKDFELIKN